MQVLKVFEFKINLLLIGKNHILGVSRCHYVLIFKTIFSGYTKYMLTFRNIVIRSKKQYPPQILRLGAACHYNVLTFFSG